jgi:hypothetical protein
MAAAQFGIAQKLQCKETHILGFFTLLSVIF